MDKVFVKIKTAEAKQGTNDVYSGEYIITGIVHNINKDSQYTMILVLSRNGMNKTKSFNEYSSKLIEV